MGSIHNEVSHTALKLQLDYHDLQKLEGDPKKTKEPEFPKRSSDSSTTEPQDLPHQRDSNMLPDLFFFLWKLQSTHMHSA